MKIPVFSIAAFALSFSSLSSGMKPKIMNYDSYVNANLDEKEIVVRANKFLKLKGANMTQRSLYIAPTNNHIEGRYAGLPLFGTDGDSYAFSAAIELLKETNIKVIEAPTSSCADKGKYYMLESGIRSYDPNIESKFKSYEPFVEHSSADASLERGSGYTLDRFSLYTRLVLCSNGKKEGKSSFQTSVYAMSTQDKSSFFVLPQVLGFFYSQRASTKEGLNKQKDLATIYLVAEILVDSFIKPGFFEKHVLQKQFAIARQNRNKFIILGDGLAEFSEKYINVVAEDYSGKLHEMKKTLRDNENTVTFFPKNEHAFRKVYLELFLAGASRAKAQFRYNEDL